tara:strand:+ start:603 stop:818 length:216 start_codon:yes stop_codon:yes gene_type:complete
MAEKTGGLFANWQEMSKLNRVGREYSIGIHLGFKTYTLKASALPGASYCFNGLNNPTNHPPIPGTIECIEY